VHHWIESVSAGAGGAGFIVPTLLNGVAGIVAGAVVLVGVLPFWFVVDVFLEPSPQPSERGTASSSPVLNDPALSLASQLPQ